MGDHNYVHCGENGDFCLAMLHKTIDIENVIPYIYDKTNAEKHFRDPSTKISAVSRGSEQEGRPCHIRQSVRP